MSDLTDAVETTLDKLFTRLADYFAVEDYAQFWIVLGAAAAHYLPGEPLWLRIIGPTRAGKTELLRAFFGHPDIAKLENVTIAAIRGGLDGGNRVLPRLNGKLVITKEMAQIHTMRKDARREIMGVLRGVKDGEITSDFGTKGDSGHLEQKVTFDWICATTKAGAQDRQMDDLLGARFLDLNYIPGEREDATERAILNTTIAGNGTEDVRTKLDQARLYMGACVWALLDCTKKLADEEPPSLSPKLRGEIVLLANAASWLRTPVQRNYGKIVDTPDREAGTEIGQGLARLARGLMLLGVKDTLPHLARVAHDCIPEARRFVLRRLLAGDNGVREIARKLAFPPSTVENLLDELHILRVIERRVVQEGQPGETVTYHLHTNPGGALKELFRQHDSKGVHR